ncbi:MAG: YicC/YloC family endoribonuclease [Bacillota bacterium]|nr:YicC/YloC family endoribonuclease [Bacillota bacterium]
MICSMTGYGRNEFENEEYKISVEIKTVNHKYCNIYSKIPSSLNPIEDKIKKHIQNKLNRGRIELNIYLTEKGEDQLVIKPNFKVLDKYHKTLTEIKKRYKIEADIDLELLVKYKDSIDIEYNEIDHEKIFKVIVIVLDEVIDSVLEMRIKEGEKLRNDIETNLNLIEKILTELSLKTNEIIFKHRENMRRKINDLLENIEIDSDRLEQEIAIYVDKTDINEEIIRINSHIQQFREMLLKGGVIGHKLDFLSQELNREINTIGSKSPDVNITNYVVDMKSLVGKIREQVQNIE